MHRLRRDDHEVFRQRAEDAECVDGCDAHAEILLWNRQELRVRNTRQTMGEAHTMSVFGLGLRVACVDEDVDLVRALDSIVCTEMFACLDDLVVLELVRVRLRTGLPLTDAGSINRQSARLQVSSARLQPGGSK